MRCCNSGVPVSEASCTLPSSAFSLAAQVRRGFSFNYYNRHFLPEYMQVGAAVGRWKRGAVCGVVLRACTCTASTGMSASVLILVAAFRAVAAQIVCVLEAVVRRYTLAAAAEVLLHAYASSQPAAAPAMPHRT